MTGRLVASRDTGADVMNIAVDALSLTTLCLLPPLVSAWERVSNISPNSHAGEPQVLAINDDITGTEKGQKFIQNFIDRRSMRQAHDKDSRSVLPGIE